MKRFVNVRFPLILATSLIAGIIAGCLFSYFGISLFWLTAVIPVNAVIFIVCAICNKLDFKLLLLTFTFAIFCAGAVNCCCRLNAYGKSQITDGGVYGVCAAVEDKGENVHGEYIVLKNVTLDGAKANGKIIAYLSDKYGDFCDVGYKVTFTAEIKRHELFIGGQLNYNVQDNIKYSCNIYGGLKAEYGFSLFGTIRSAIRKTLYSNLDMDTAAVAFAMLTGNAQGIEDGAMTGFRYGGVAHVFAVSGLHIGIVFGIIRFICKRLKQNKYLTAVLCLFPVFFYVGVCGFTPSSVRAAVMCAVSVCAKLFHKKYDGLNSLSLAVIIILLIAPFGLFSLGFQLSVCAAGGIILLSKSIARPFKKIPKRVANAVSVSLSAQLATFPVLLANFGYVSGIGLLMNIFVLPLLSVIYVILFISTVFATIFSFSAPFIVPITALPLQAVVSFFLNAGFEKALISGFGGGAFAPIYFIGLISLSDKVNIKSFYRVGAVVCTASVLCVYSLLF